MTGFAFDTAGIGFDNSIYGYDGVVAPGHNNAAWTNTGGALSTAPNAPQLRFNSGLTATPSSAALNISGATPSVSIGNSNVVPFPLAAGHSYTRLGAMVAVFPRDDSDTSVQSWERHKLCFAGLPFRVPILIWGGVAPFHASVSGPAGLTVGADLPVDWETNGPGNYLMLMEDSPSLGTAVITLTITDQLGDILSISWSRLCASSNDTTKGRFYDSLNGSNSNPGTYAQPYKDDLSLVYGTTSGSTTFQGHVVFINRGTTYVMPTHSDLAAHRFQFDNTKRPVVQYSLPLSGSVQNNAKLSWANTQIYFGNQSGACFGELDWDGGVSSLNNYTNFLVGDGQDRMLFYNFNITNPTNGSVGDDNTTAVGAASGSTSNDATNNHYIGWRNVWESGRLSASNACGLWDWYGCNYFVADFCGTADGYATPAMNFKDSCQHVSSRYCKLRNAGSGNYAIDLLGVSQNGGTNGNVEFVYFRADAHAGAGQAVRFNAFADPAMGPVHLKRCTLTGVVDIRLPNTSTGPYLVENCTIQTSTTPRVTSGSNITNSGTETQGSSGIIDANMQLISGTNLGRRGHQIA